MAADKSRSSSADPQMGDQLSGTHSDHGPDLSRRSFLKLGLMSLTPLALSGIVPARGLPAALRPVRTPVEAPSPVTQDLPPAPRPFGRTTRRQPIRQEPSTSSAIVRWMERDSILPLHGAVEGAPPWPTNAVWYQTDGGYIHSGYTHPVGNQPQDPILEVPNAGFWGQVAVPWADARWSPGPGSTMHRLYYGTVYRVIEVVEGADGEPWYRLKEGISPWQPGPYVPASSLRRVTREEMEPISRGVPDKTMLIDLDAQTVTCMEGDETVFSTRTATGLPRTPTPRGEYRVTYKRTTRRMTMRDIPSPYDLPGVPFCIYFTWAGHASHGTYWHNDYGRRQSNGCVNLTPDNAQWVFRWADPVVPYEAYTVFTEPREAGTRIVVV
jgi:lipoprotein-anchoring transpeptidase ErfK/SrfK